MKLQILSIDDSDIHQKLVASALGEEHNVLLAPTLKDARDILSHSRVDLILLDVSLPDGDGFSFYSQLQADDKWCHLPLMFVTSRSDIANEVIGFSLGTEDCIVKPVEPGRLRSRIATRIKQIEAHKQRPPMLRKGNLRICLRQRRVIVHQTDCEVEVDLTPVEFKLLIQMLKNEDHVFSRAQLLESVWGNAAQNIMDRTVDMHVSNLRKKLSVSEFRIQAIHGAGYRMTKQRLS